MKILEQQYQHITSSREVLLNYCKTLSQKALLEKLEGFGNANIHYLLLHIANCYKFWIASQALQRETSFLEYEKTYSFSEIRDAFKEVDAFMSVFLNTRFPTEIQYEFRTGVKGTASPLKLFTHVTTHEFHHKGQILSMSRHMGYTPVDTDVMR
ncbi:MAG: DinB family protein [Flavobacteriaceae bacterium]